MAMLKSSVVQGSLRVTDTTYTTNLNLSGASASLSIFTDANKNLITKSAAEAWSALGGGASGTHADSYFVKAITSTDNNIPRFNGTGGQLQSSRMSIADTGLITLSYNGRYPGDTQYHNAAGRVGEFWLDTGHATNVTSPRFYWAVWRPKETAATTTESTYEAFRLPAATAGTAKSVTYEIITTKNLANITAVGTITSGTWSGTKIGIEHGGTNATTAADARTNLGLGSIATYNAAPAGTKDTWGLVPVIGADGVIEIGKYIDFHTTDGNTKDYDVRITAATTGLTISGTTTGTFSGNLTGDAVGKSSSWIAYPGGGTYSTQTESVTGALKITLPQIAKNTMMSFDVNIYTYDGDNKTSCVYHISGYEYSNNGWYNPVCRVYSEGKGNYTDLTVRFGAEDSKACVTIGETNTVWKCPQVAVSNILLGYKNGNFATWGTGWTVSFVTTLPSTITGTYNDANVQSINVTGTATKWAAECTLTIGNKGQQVDGSKNVSWSLADIGAAPSSTISCTAANIESALGIDFITHSGALNTNGWKTLGGRARGSKIAIAYNNNPASWNSSTYSSSLVFGCSDTRGLLDIGYNTPVVTFGGASNGNSTDNDPKWYFKLSGTSGQTYTFPATSKTLAASDGSNASGSWGISITGSAGSVAWANTGHPSTFPPTIGTTATTAAAGDHTHDISLSKTGTSTINLAANTVYTLTAGGKSVVFKTPADNNTNTTYTFAEGSTSGAFSVTPSGGNAQSVSIHGLGTAAYKAEGDFATASHTHDISLSKTGTSTINLTANTVYTLTAGGESIVFKTPADGNTDLKVKQNANTENKEFSILLKTTNNTTAETGEVKFGNTSNKLVTVNPSTGTITAPTFKGALTGNASGTASNVTGTVTIGHGGTGATDAAGARTNLGLGTIATYNAVTAGSTDTWGKVPVIGDSNGIMEVGKYIDFHSTDGNTANYDIRLEATTTELKLTGAFTASGNILVNKSSTSSEANIMAQGKAGKISLFSQGSTSGTFGIYSVNASGKERAVLWCSQSGDITTAYKLYGAVWNDYAEYRQASSTEPGRVVIEKGNDTLILSTKRLQPGAEIISDTFGFAIGQTDGAKTPIATSGRVLAYPYESREEFKANIGKPVCSGPNGTVSIMTQEEYEKYGYCAIGTISAVPDYEEWGSDSVAVNGRVWIRVR